MNTINNNLIFYSLLFMSFLVVWSVFWIVISIFRIKHNTSNKIFWQVSLFWNIINFIIAFSTIYTTLQLETYSLGRAETMRNIVAINVFLDLVYIIVALLLKKSANETKNQIGSAILIQGSFLLILDVLIVIVFQNAIN